jgi:hypothetical protein
MGQDFIPKQDNRLSPFLQTFLSGTLGHEVVMGITTGERTAINDGYEDWNGALAACQAAETAWSSALETKNQARAAVVALVRLANAKVQVKLPGSDALKTGAGLPSHDTTPTRAPAPSTRPVLEADTSQRLQHTLSYRDETTPLSRAKPAGVREIEVWCKIGSPAPADAGECALVGTSSTSSLVVTHKGADAGKPAHYLARWKNAHAECGPWSETVVATIGA